MYTVPARRNFGDTLADASKAGLSTYAQRSDELALQKTLSELPPNALPQEVLQKIMGTHTYGNDAKQAVFGNYLKSAGLQSQLAKGMEQSRHNSAIEGLTKQKTDASVARNVEQAKLAREQMATQKGINAATNASREAVSAANISSTEKRQDKDLQTKRNKLDLDEKYAAIKVAQDNRRIDELVRSGASREDIAREKNIADAENSSELNRIRREKNDIDKISRASELAEKKEGRLFTQSNESRKAGLQESRLKLDTDKLEQEVKYKQSRLDLDNNKLAAEIDYKQQRLELDTDALKKKTELEERRLKEMERSGASKEDIAKERNRITETLGRAKNDLDTRKIDLNERKTSFDQIVAEGRFNLDIQKQEDEVDMKQKRLILDMDKLEKQTALGEKRLAEMSKSNASSEAIALEKVRQADERNRLYEEISKSKQDLDYFRHDLDERKNEFEQSMESRKTGLQEDKFAFDVEKSMLDMDYRGNKLKLDQEALERKEARDMREMDEKIRRNGLTEEIAAKRNQIADENNRERNRLHQEANDLRYLALDQKERQEEAKLNKPKESQFDKTVTDKGTERYAEAVKEYPKLVDQLKNVSKLRDLAENVKGGAGFIKGVLGVGGAADFDTQAIVAVQPILKIFNPAGPIAIRKAELIINKFAPKSTEVQATINSKINTLEMLAQQALDRAKKEIDLYGKYKGNPPVEEILKLDQESNAVLDTFTAADTKTGTVSGYYSTSNGRPIKPVSLQQALELTKQGLITNVKPQ